MMANQFRDRADAGQRLAQRLQAYRHDSQVVVVALPRGGVPVAYEIAKALQAPLDICLVRKLGVPGQPELAMGAIAVGGIEILNSVIINGLEISQGALEAVATRELEELERRDRVYRGPAPPLNVQDCTLILVDDGLATGCSMRAAIAALKRQHPQRIIVAVPIASSTTCAQLESEVDQIVCLQQPEHLYAIGNWYQNFAQTTDTEVCELLAKQQQAMLTLAGLPQTAESGGVSFNN